MARLGRARRIGAKFVRNEPSHDRSQIPRRAFRFVFGQARTRLQLIRRHVRPWKFSAPGLVGAGRIDAPVAAATADGLAPTAVYEVTAPTAEATAVSDAPTHQH